METLRCHSYQTSHIIEKQYTIYEENNVNIMHAQY